MNHLTCTFTDALTAYGLPLYTMQYPCGICLAPPCFVPRGMTRDQIEGSACCGMSSIKVFLRRSGISGDDLLFASQAEGFNKIVFFIAIDRVRKKLIIALRGSESMPDAMTDAACKPTNCASIDECCFCHDGFRQSMLSMFETFERDQRTQQFLAENKDFGIVVVGHSLGAGVTVLLTLQLLKNSGNNPNYTGRDIHGYALAAPPAVCTEYADKMEKEAEKHITIFLYGKDMIARLQWNSIMKIKCAVLRLLRQCQQSALWVHRHGLNANSETILSALDPSSSYIVRNGDANKLKRARQKWNDDIRKDIAKLKVLSDIDRSQWDIELQHIGKVFHIVNGNEVHTKLKRRNRGKCAVCCSYICTAMCNCVRCKCCNPMSPMEETSFVIYRADPKGFDDILVSSRMASHHMPHVYKQVMESLDLQHLK